MFPIPMFILKKFDPGEQGYWTLANDDSPTVRFGPFVEAADIHDNPTLGVEDGTTSTPLCLDQWHPLRIDATATAPDGKYERVR